MRNPSILSLLSLFLLNSAFAAPAGNYMCTSTNLLGGKYEVEVRVNTKQEWPTLDAAIFNPGEEIEIDHVDYPPAYTNLDTVTKSDAVVIGNQDGLKSIVEIDYESGKRGPFSSRLLKAAGMNPSGSIKLYPGTLEIKKSTIFSKNASPFKGEVNLVCVFID